MKVLLFHKIYETIDDQLVEARQYIDNEYLNDESVHWLVDLFCIRGGGRKGIGAKKNDKN